MTKTTNDQDIKKTEYFDALQPVLPVYINNRNRLSSVVALTRWLEAIPYVEIVILDNGSTYPPLLEWYRETTHTVLLLQENLGQCALWVHNRFTTDDVQLQFQRQGDWYAHTDADIVPREDCPHDALLVFKQLMEEHSHLYKVGFGLEILDLPDHYALKDNVVNWENRFWQTGISPRAFSASIDTTFALHHKGRGSRVCPDLPPPHQGHQMDPALRTNYPYVARHTPWYVDSNHLGEEERFYMEHAGHMASWSNALRRALDEQR